MEVDALEQLPDEQEPSEVIVDVAGGGVAGFSAGGRALTTVAMAALTQASALERRASASLADVPE